MRLENGDIMLTRVNRFSRWYRALFAAGIKFFDKGFYHHAVLFCEYCFHEADTEVMPRPLAHYNGDKVLILTLLVPLDSSEERLYISLCKDELAKKYDYLGALFFQLIYRIFGIWFGRTGAKAEKRPFCSEHSVTPIHKMRGYFQDKYKLSPGDIRRLGGLYYRVKFEGTFNSKDWTY